jgi:hypothetical protein
MHFTDKISFRNYITDDQVQYAFNEFQYEKFEDKYKGHKGKNELTIKNFPSELEKFDQIQKGGGGAGMTFAGPKK